MFRRAMLATLAVVAVVAMLGMSPQSARADDRDFVLVNGSQRIILEVYVGPSDSDDWGDDILGRDVLMPGESVTIVFSRFDGNAGKCAYDVRVVARDGGEGRIMGVNLCTTSSVTFN